MESSPATDHIRRKSLRNAVKLFLIEDLELAGRDLGEYVDKIESGAAFAMESSEKFRM